MTDINNQIEYWDSVAWEKEFTLPLDTARFRELVPSDGRILDYGCGYGRIAAQLHGAGYRNIVGVDPAPQMIERAGKEHPGIDFQVADTSTLPFDDASFDAALLVAVLTAVPGDDRQMEIVNDIHRVLKPGGIAYITDFRLQSDERNIKRYKECEKVYGKYGVFNLPYGAILRHHDMGWIADLVSPFETISLDEADVSTMNGNPAKAFQFFGRKPCGEE